ncbi:type III-A CRISPR-associated RAMP protein Csm3 [Lactobacillus delbrueckii]|uniref:type III-A CRISPR-associated RAMP protein Csm3 n=1 Tax=Lactobacillus delbrueckii TaxID=1584 RepID=UPI001E5808DA|nr:type III-A CRISPR-associated RAMP protein Csm3 [Lactobacillus delbrueckii]MCD5451819.1 type III-A CRISPR-associated RAMP protein Csm3 [Lactobacillus delbrueckii subsp. lactis]
MLNLAKIRFSGNLEVESGLHIGASSAFAAIGAIDSPVIKDPVTNLPIIPGSSLKGKMRTLLARSYNQRIAETPNDDDERICRLFGASTGGGRDGQSPIAGRLIFRDSFLANKDELMDKGLSTFTEDKFENTINRTTMIASPRQIERVVRGSKFAFELIYDVVDSTEVDEDLEMILAGLKLLEFDYLGGSGSRGYGKVAFKDLKAETVFGNFDVEALNQKLEG